MQKRKARNLMEQKIDPVVLWKSMSQDEKKHFLQEAIEAIFDQNEQLRMERDELAARLLSPDGATY